MPNPVYADYDVFFAHPGAYFSTKVGNIDPDLNFGHGFLPPGRGNGARFDFWIAPDGVIDGTGVGGGGGASNNCPNYAVGGDDIFLGSLVVYEDSVDQHQGGAGLDIDSFGFLLPNSAHFLGPGVADGTAAAYGRVFETDTPDAGDWYFVGLPEILRDVSANPFTPPNISVIARNGGLADLNQIDASPYSFKVLGTTSTSTTSTSTLTSTSSTTTTSTTTDSTSTSTSSSTTSTSSTTCCPLKVSNDFDGDGASDIGVYVPRKGRFEGNWFIRNSSNGQTNTIPWGHALAIPAPGDYDNDGFCDVGVYWPGDLSSWHIRQSSDGRTNVLAWGVREAVPVQGNYDGDGLTDVALYAPDDLANWHILRSSDGELLDGRPIVFGGSGALPVPGYYDRDCLTDLAVFFPEKGEWHIRRSSDGITNIVSWGWHETVPAPGDYDGDCITDLAVYLPDGGLWYILQSSDGRMKGGGPIEWGWNEAAPVPGDYDGDGVTDLAVYSLRDGTWYILKSSDGKSLIIPGHRIAIPVTPLYQVYRWFGLVP